MERLNLRELNAEHSGASEGEHERPEPSTLLFHMLLVVINTWDVCHCQGPVCGIRAQAVCTYFLCSLVYSLCVLA